MNTHMNIIAIVGWRVDKKGVDNGMECFIMSTCSEFGDVGNGTTWEKV